MKLLGSTSSPYVRKVRVVLAEKKLECAFVVEDVWGTDTTISESNPLGKVPCLIMEGAEALFDSRVIVEYVAALTAGKVDEAKTALLSVSSAYAKASKDGVVHKSTAQRKRSRLQLRLNAAAAAPKAAA